MQTIAIYKEERVKVYSITQKDGLVLIVLSFPTSEIGLWGQRVMELEEQIKRFELVTSHSSNKEKTILHLLFDEKKLEFIHEELQKWQKASPDTELKNKQSVELIYLHGPHFQDRFGIADVAFDALRKKNITILVSGCAGTSMYLVLPPLQGQKSQKILTETFLIPS